MRCQQCRRKGTVAAYSYGGMLLCFSCNEFHNPQTEVIYRLPEATKKRLEEKKWELEKQLRDINNQLDTDKRMEQEGQTQINVRIPRKEPLSFFN